MEVEFLFSADCPSHEQALARLQKVLREAGWSGRIGITEITSTEQARQRGFVGSPTLLFDGEDIDRAGLAGESPGLGCRIYRLEDGRISPLPSERMIREALRRKWKGEAEGGAAGVPPEDDAADNGGNRTQGG